MKSFEAERIDLRTRRRFLSRFRQYFDSGYRDPELLYLGSRYALALGRFQEAAIFLEPLDEILIVDGKPLSAYAPVALLWLHVLRETDNAARHPSFDKDKLERTNEYLSILAQNNEALAQVIEAASEATDSLSGTTGGEREQDQRLEDLSQCARTHYEHNQLAQARAMLEEMLLIDGDPSAVLRNLVTVTSEQEDIDGYERYWRRFVKVCLWRIVCGGLAGAEAWSGLMRFYVRAADMMEQPLGDTPDSVKRLLKRPGFLPRWIESVVALIWLESADKSHRMWQSNLTPEQLQQGRWGYLGLMQHWLALFYPEFEPLLHLKKGNSVALPLSSAEAGSTLYFDPTERLVSRFFEWHALHFALRTRTVASRTDEQGQPLQELVYDDHAENIVALASCVARTPLQYHTLHLAQATKDERKQQGTAQTLRQHIQEAVSYPLFQIRMSQLLEDPPDWSGIATFFDDEDMHDSLTPLIRMFHAYALCNVERPFEGFVVACSVAEDASADAFAPKSQNFVLWKQIIIANLNDALTVPASHKGKTDKWIDENLEQLREHLNKRLSDQEPSRLLKREALSEIKKIEKQRDLQKRVDKAIEKAKDFVAQGKFNQARQTIGRLPNTPEDVKKLKQQFLEQINKAEEESRLQKRIDEAIEKAKRFVTQGKFKQARQTIGRLPNTPREVKKLKQQFIAQINEAEEESRLQKRIDEAIEKAKRFVTQGKFAQARQAINRLPNTPGEVKKLKQQFIAQINEAEEGSRLQKTIDSAVSGAKRAVERGDFASARSKIRALSGGSAEMIKLKRQLLKQIDDAETASRQLNTDVTDLLSDLTNRGVSFESIMSMAKENNIDIKNQAQFYALLEAIKHHVS